MRLTFITIFISFLLSSRLFASHLPDQVILGTRFQGVLSQSNSETHQGVRTREQDFYLRRARFEVKLLWNEGWSQFLDIRNDNSNRGDRGEEKFVLGDAYIAKSIKRGHTVHDISFFRAKVDISRSQTVSSADLIYLNRAHSSDFASNYISHNRRATNMQWNGLYADKLQWQLAIGDGVQSDGFSDANGNTVSSISENRLMYGGKLRFYILGKAQPEVDENFFDDDSFISFGTGIYRQDNIKFTFSNSRAQIDRTLTNIELTGHFGPLNVMAEYFSFSNVHLNFNDSLNQTYKSEAYYIQADYRFTPKFGLFARYEDWDKAVDVSKTGLNNIVFGAHYYHRKDAIKFGIFWDKTTYDSGISSMKEDTTLLFTTMLHFR